MSVVNSTMNDRCRCSPRRVVRAGRVDGIHLWLLVVGVDCEWRALKVVAEVAYRKVHCEKLPAEGTVRGFRGGQHVGEGAERKQLPGAGWWRAAPTAAVEASVMRDKGASTRGWTRREAAHSVG